ncbi:putative claudin-24 [Pangasianodon hypophthalmus]|uniref:putative claudin-24 n=1 Tax=Pangasianodon hypophthalmus TaxID=310915 RepID=UPI000F0015B7|nr:putative claudin-24 [Pangasianodon hypophthalmus]
MSNPCSSILELLGMIVGVGAWICSLAATLMPSWLTLTTELLAVESYELGLWETCVVQEGSATECRPFETLLGLSHNQTLARICMCIAHAIALLGLLIAAPGLRLVKSCEGSAGRRVKRGIKITAGVLILIAGTLILFPVSKIAHETVLKFHDHSLPHTVPRPEFGDALFIGWAAGFFHVVSAVLFFVSCCGSEVNEMHIVYHHEEKLQPVNGLSKKRVEYV